ncbi:hypothetical protein GQ457_05G013320 [Hibiscus cannabinus]
MARFEEGRSISCPPLFEGEAYSQWSNVMKYFIQAQDFELWDIIEEGYIEAPKKKKKQRSENDTKAKLNSRAMHILLCGLNEEVSKKVSTCKRAKEMWEKLERLYCKEEKKDGAPSCANLLSSSKVDGVLALNEPEKMARFEEGRSISCPPLFEGEAYSQWSNVMKYFIQAQDFELWDIIEEGYIEAPKKKKKQRSENDTKAKLNSRAMHILLCGLNEEVSKKVSTCKRAKEMWEKLERLYCKEEKKDGAPSCANLLSSSKVDGVLALNEPECILARHLVLDQKERGTNVNKATVADTQSPPSPPVGGTKALPPKNENDFRPTAPGHSPGAGHSFQN